MTEFEHMLVNSFNTDTLKKMEEEPSSYRLKKNKIGLLPNFLMFS